MMKYASFPEGYLEEAGPDQRLRVSTDLGLERGVDEPVSSKHSLALELRRNNHSLESLSAI
jgi:hypothetical protein